jgi:hypothetical protein
MLGNFYFNGVALKKKNVLEELIGCWPCIQPFERLDQIQLWKMICEWCTFGLRPKFKLG